VLAHDKSGHLILFLGQVATVGHIKKDWAHSPPGQVIYPTGQFPDYNEEFLSVDKILLLALFTNNDSSESYYFWTIIAVILQLT
jgi:hypothetical protein